MFRFFRRKSSLKREATVKRDHEISVLQNELKELQVLLDNTECVVNNEFIIRSKALADIESKKADFENRVEYLNEVKAVFLDTFSESNIDIQEFKDTCAKCVECMNDLEVVKTELHAMEVDFATMFEYYEDNEALQSLNINRLKTKIQFVEDKISELITDKQ